MSVRQCKGVKREGWDASLGQIWTNPLTKATQAGTVVQKWKLYDTVPRESQRYMQKYSLI